MTIRHKAKDELCRWRERELLNVNRSILLEILLLLSLHYPSAAVLWMLRDVVAFTQSSSSNIFIKGILILL